MSDSTGLLHAGTTRAIQKHLTERPDLSGSTPASREEVIDHYSAEERPYERKTIQAWGYDQAWLHSMGLPEAIADQASGGGCPLRLGPLPNPGDTVVDMACGAGHDLCVAAALVGSSGRVLGLDITPAQLERARQTLSQCKGLLSRVTLMQHALDRDAIPESICSTADLVISNGAFNLMANKQKAFDNACAVLKPGGFFYLSDVVKMDRAVVVS